MLVGMVFSSMGENILSLSWIGMAVIVSGLIFAVLKIRKRRVKT